MGYWETKRKTAAAARTTRYRDLAAGSLDQVAHHAQPQTPMTVLGGEAGHKNLFPVLLGNPDSRIPRLQQHSVALHTAHNTQYPARGHGLNRIPDEIMD